MTDDVTTARVHPHRRLVDTWRIGYENERIAWPQPARDRRPLTEDGTTHRSAKVFGVRVGCRHLPDRGRTPTRSIP